MRGRLRHEGRHRLAPPPLRVPSRSVGGGYARGGAALWAPLTRFAEIGRLKVLGVAA